MSAITAQQLPTAVKSPANADKLNSILVLLDRCGDRIGPRSAASRCAVACAAPGAEHIIANVRGGERENCWRIGGVRRGLGDITGEPLGRHVL
jgi:hypothetical protein